MSDRRVLPLAPDTANQAFYDTHLKKYVANIRVWAPAVRKVGRVEMDDSTQPWPFTRVEKPYRIWGEGKVACPSREVPVVFGYDEHDPRSTDHYNPACVQYPWAADAYFLFPSAFRHSMVSKGGVRSGGMLDIQMAASRDGIHFTRLALEPYVGLGQEDEIDSGQLYMAVGIVRNGNKIYQYYGGYNFTHDDAETAVRGGSICLVQQRLDGFVSADAAYEGGELTTPPLTFSGKRLLLN